MKPTAFGSFSYLRIVVALALLGSGPLVVWTQTEAPMPRPAAGISSAGLQPIFNQTNLDGWEIRGGKAGYVVADGGIVGTVTAKGGANTFLCTTQDYGDFILELEVKADAALNSGVQIRSQYSEQPATYQFGTELLKVPAKRVNGYQVEVDNRADRRWSGGIYEEGRRGWLFPLATNSAAGRAFRLGEWNHYRIECRGASLRTWVNEVAAADLVDAETLQGFIGLQVHASEQPGLQVRFRNLRLRDLGVSRWETAWDCRSLDGLDRSGPAEWRLVDGAVLASQSATATEPGRLQGQTPLADFSTRFKFKIQQGSFEFTLHPASGGAAFRFNFGAAVEPKALRRDDWNTLTAAVLGQRIVLNLNGRQLHDAAGAVAAGGVLPGLVLPAGQGAEVAFKDFEILTKVE